MIERLTRNVFVREPRKSRITSFSEPTDSPASIAVIRQRAICELHGRPLPEPEMPHEEFRKRQMARGIFVEPTRTKS